MDIIPKKLTTDFVDMLQEIHFDTLPISDYNKKYIRRILPKMDYYADIYFKIVEQYIKVEKLFPAKDTVVDYGGGHGFLSIFLKMRGISRVIYVDKNPESVAAASTIKDAVGLGADVFLCGEEEELIDWCRANGVKPSLLIGLDVIEHIYDLEKYLGNLFTEFTEMYHCYTTASVKENPFKSRRLKKQMYLDEYGTATKQGYFDMRKQFIMKEYPSLSDQEANLWAADTRGMNYHDISMALELGMDVKPMDDYNTCDPETGNWTERILSDIDYIVLALKFGSMAMCSSGHYNEHNKGIKKIVAKMLNMLMEKKYFNIHIRPFTYIQMPSPASWRRTKENLKIFFKEEYDEIMSEKTEKDKNNNNDTDD